MRLIWNCHKWDGMMMRWFRFRRVIVNPVRLHLVMPNNSYEQYWYVPKYLLRFVLSPSQSDTKDHPHRARPKWNTPHRCLPKTIRARGATSFKSRTKATSHKRSRWRVACNHDATTWMAVVCRHRAGSVCSLPKSSIQMWMSLAQPQRQRHPYKTSRPISNIYRSVPVHRVPPMVVPSKMSTPKSKSTVMDTMKLVVSKCDCTTIGSSFRAHANAGDQTISLVTYAESLAAAICSSIKFEIEYYFYQSTGCSDCTSRFSFPTHPPIWRSCILDAAPEMIIANYKDVGNENWLLA